MKHGPGLVGAASALLSFLRRANPPISDTEDLNQVRLAKLVVMFMTASLAEMDDPELLAEIETVIDGGMR